MKNFLCKKITTSCAIIILALITCSCNSKKDNETIDLTTLQTTETTTAITTEKPTTTVATTTESTQDDEVSRLVAEAHEKANNTKSIESGELYESVIAVYSDVKLFEESDSLFIWLYLKKSSPQVDSEMFFNLIKKILSECTLENDYNSVIFTMFVDNSSVTTMTLLNYKNSTNFESVEPIVFIDDYKEPISSIYKNNFSNLDVATSFDNELKQLEKKYMNPDPSNTKDFNYTADQFIFNANLYFSALGSTMQASSIETSEYEDVVYSVINDSSTNSTYLLTFNISSKNLSSILFVAAIKNTPEVTKELTYSLLATAMAAEVLTDDLTKLSQMISDMLVETNANGSSSNINNNLQYSMIIDENHMLYFVIKPN